MKRLFIYLFFLDFLDAADFIQLGTFLPFFVFIPAIL